MIHRDEAEKAIVRELFPGNLPEMVPHSEVLQELRKRYPGGRELTEFGEPLVAKLKLNEEGTRALLSKVLDLVLDPDYRRR